ncbi:MAG: hypothetical protein PVG40_10895 [Desulfobacterales bacterium]
MLLIKRTRRSYTQLGCSIFSHWKHENGNHCDFFVAHVWSFDGDKAMIQKHYRNRTHLNPVTKNLEKCDILFFMEKMENNYTVEIVDAVTTVRFLIKPGPDEIRKSIDEVALISASGLRLWDLSAGGWDLTSEKLEEIADYAKTKLMLPSKVAIVAPKDLSYGLSRVYEALRRQEGLEIEIFRDEQKALSWLKVDSA